MATSRATVAKTSLRIHVDAANAAELQANAQDILAEIGAKEQGDGV
jgi:hypothetical protein